ncbi:MAG TPA: fused MFS/spermidine synthase, partial [Gemmatimonadales bacterium]|nr:fused MFS/spermidine synthase [Gemmatimonadales bacterium]
MRSRTAQGYRLLFFLSGATGLVYELLWVRLLYQAFGSTIQSVTTVVAAYMGGLGLGAWLLGRRVDRHPRPAALYGKLELAIGAFGIVSPLVLDLARRVYVATAAGMGLAGGASVALRFGLAALVLLIPTTLMGGTLPVLTRAFTGDEREQLKPALAGLYGLNTLGAVAGTALTGFFLIEYVGIRAALLATAALNLAIGVIAIRSAKFTDPGRGPGESDSAPKDLLHRTALVLLAVTAFASLLDEIGWTRVLVMIVGGSTYAFTLILLVFLLGIGLGSALVHGKSAPRRDAAAQAALAQGLTATGAAILFLGFGVLPLYILWVVQHTGWHAGAQLAWMGVAVGGVVLIPALGMGMTFPLLADLVARPGAARGRDVGGAYALNTVGSILGAVLTGFVLVVTLGTDVTLRVGIAVNVVAALTLAALAARGVPENSAEHRRLRPRVLAAAALACVGLATAVAAPRWSTRLIDAGPTIYGRQPMTPAERRSFLDHWGVRQVAYKEGWNATASVWESGVGRTLKVNGKADASDHGDMDTQILLGLAPVAARANARSALVIGYGSGVTTRALADVPGMARVHVVEIEPAVLAMSDFFSSVNGDVLHRPTVSAVVDDARSALQIHPETYDVIVSEPSNPWVAGVATLYTPEFFRVVRRRLAPDGVFCQWVQLYQLPLPVVAGIVRNVRAVFPHVQVWFSSPWDLMVVGSANPLRYDSAWLDRLFGASGSVAGLGREYLAIDAPGDYFGHFLLGEAGVARLVALADLTHTDDRPALEFVAARRFLDSEGVGVVFDSLVTIAASARDGAAPALLAKALSVPAGDRYALPYIEAMWRAQPRDPLWATSVATTRLGLGDTAFAETTLQQVSAYPPAQVLLGRIALERGQNAKADELLRRALAAGADGAEIHAGLAVLAVRARRWEAADRETRAVFATAKSTLRHPYPRDLLTEALDPFAMDAPAALAESLLAAAVVSRGGYARFHELHAIASIRAG